MDPRELEFLRDLNCTEDEPCNNLKKEVKGKKHPKRKGGNDGNNSR